MIGNIEKFVKDVLHEDLGRGDLFERLIGDDFLVTAKIIAKENGVFSGGVYIQEICRIYDIACKWNVTDTQEFFSGQTLIELHGHYKILLKLERTILNILQHSSGIASNTFGYMKMLDGVSITILDTRKTRPLLREFEKYSVRNGGAKNHRMGLDDTLMLKDTHLKYIKNQDLKSFIDNARKYIPWTAKIEIESESIEFAKIAMQSGVDIVMCDNMRPEDIKEVVNFRNANYPYVLLEGSGRITKDTIIEYAKSGVDAISIGSLIHQAVWVDMSMKMA
ncbi:carboxylating nicotinate-nucleotide diphosphorylase [Helicobacter cappadocius]|uniref:nicotinate-nucleotide diphosphorylase (carboxylating) n=1 Tax=Helicobacter cappadocius TaxID=3063998 RepID=A0AA90PW63_9HELI|nr:MULTISPECIES: carboxylating nicotinate-nucleotide diphosphorylase [unclassified Helicobacter]MDO7253483.1 carboxylating nicotinate-nucleotide diphosphorylase [Helicobacter sp. faydin-H75]MDP2539410.1 carboxylating nicotinate-nucleotide diphosphorylase [Helicobacter sp. faydin-H76]